MVFAGLKERFRLNLFWAKSTSLDKGLYIYGSLQLWYHNLIFVSKYFKKGNRCFCQKQNHTGNSCNLKFCLIFKSWDWRKDNLQIVKSSMIDDRQKTKLVKELRCTTCNTIITLVSISVVLLSSLASSSSPYPLHPNPVARESDGCLVCIEC